MRPPYLYLAVGKKRTGKSYRTKQILAEMVIKMHRKVLIFDTQNEEQYANFPTLAYDQIGLFTLHPEISIRRIPPFVLRTGEEMTPDEKATVVIHILKHFRKGVLLLEDLNDYVYDYMPADIVGKILSQRHKLLDIIMHFHSLGAVQKKLWRHINVIRLHYCEDAVIDNREKFPNKFELFTLAENLVKDQYYAGNEYFSVEILTDTRKITGQFTPADRDKAIEDYLRGNYNRLIRPYLNFTNRDGSRQHTPGAAFDAEVDRLRQTYF